AQTSDTAAIHGRVLDQSRAGIPRATVVIANRSTGLERRVETNESGSFSISGLPVTGSYSLRGSKQGFLESKLEEVTLGAGVAAEIILQLSVAGGQTEVLISGAADDVRADQPQVGVRLNARQAEETPILNRRMTFLPLLNAANRPAINQGDIFTNQFL